VGQLTQLVVEVRTHEAEQLEHAVVVHKPLPDEIEIDRSGPESWTVAGRPVLRAVRFQDLTDDEALARSCVAYATLASTVC